jgi:AAA15 family ATPase/GTPase
MRISRIKLTLFKRFSDLEITDIPAIVRLVVLAGPNGCGKSSLFDAFNTWYQESAGLGVINDPTYYTKGIYQVYSRKHQIKIDIH